MRIELELDVATDGVPREAHQRFVVKALHHLLEQATEGQVLVKPARRAKQAGTGGPRLHKKSARSVHRFLAAVDELARNGRAPTLGEIGRHASLSGPPLAKIVNPATSAGAYAAPLIKVQKDGQAKRVTLTARGQQALAQMSSEASS